MSTITCLNSYGKLIQPQARRELPPLEATDQQLLCLRRRRNCHGISPINPPVSKQELQLTIPPDRRRTQRPNRLPHQRNSRMVLPIQRRHASKSSRLLSPLASKIPRHNHPRRLHVSPSSKHTSQPGQIRKHCWYCARAKETRR